MSLNFRIGYSAWGFLGNGVVDTPDGGRSHRMTLLKSLISRGMKIVMLQKNRDLDEAGIDLSTSSLSFDSFGFPDIDILFLEYRWPIPGRNTGISTEDRSYTPDLDRQNELIKHYNLLGKPIFIWDKDQQLSQSEINQMNLNKFLIFEPSLFPKNNRTSLLFPMDPNRTAQMHDDLASYDKNSKSIDLVYIGNQYGRDQSFSIYYNEASRLLGSPAEIYGKWTKTDQFPNVNFNCRVGFEQVHSIYTQAFANVIIAPERYYKTGQYTQRLFESLWGLCIPLVPKEYTKHEDIFPEELVVNSARDVYERLEYLHQLDNDSIVSLFNLLLKRLVVFSDDRQADTIIRSI